MPAGRIGVVGIGGAGSEDLLEEQEVADLEPEHALGSGWFLGGR